MTATYGSGVRVQIGVLKCSVLEATQGIGFLHHQSRIPASVSAYIIFELS